MLPYFIFITCFFIALFDFCVMKFPIYLQIIFLFLNVLYTIFKKFNILHCLLSSFVYFLLICLISYFIKKYKKIDAIGDGDIKFMAIVGWTLGLGNIGAFYIISGFFGIISSLFFKKTSRFPFIPSMIISYLFLLNL
ncbi:MAG: prepilin peptidase [Rickettsiales bacterium]|jgi:prepilin signal peptidase PulO-like enzyme (type II secretory pathway)|nr:prepilin peptidase [Rickettsiales bacterium]